MKDLIQLLGFTDDNRPGLDDPLVNFFCWGWGSAKSFDCELSGYHVAHFNHRSFLT